MESKDAAEIESQPGVETETAAGAAATTTNMKDRKFSWAKLRRIDSLNLEAGIVPSARGHSSQVSFPSVFFLLLYIYIYTHVKRKKE